ncbi:MAG: 50S ribosomal protein L29 [Armatimonadetes bacterium Cent15-Ar3]|nr:MAG: 50S ribosomal protein L29 [Armatimonadetes bacterium Cent15-Ar3]
MKAKELRDKSVAELEQMVKDEQAAAFKARRDLAFRQLTDTASFKIRRHNIARILTVINEKKRGNA